MEAILEKSLLKCGNDGKYQFSIMLLTIVICMFGELLVAVFSYLEIKPMVLYLDKAGYQHKDYLIYELCRNGTNFTILESESRQSFVYDFEIYCDELKISLLGTSYFIGVFLGSLTSPLYSDHLGRKKTILITSIGFTSALCIYTVVTNLYLLYILLFVTGYFSIIIFLTSIILLNEIVSNTKRSLYSTFIYMSFSFSGILYSVLFMYLNSWRLIFLLSGIIAIVFIFVAYNYATESPRYLLSQGLVRDYLDSIYYIAQKNDNDTFMTEDRFKMSVMKLITSSENVRLLEYKHDRKDTNDITTRKNVKNFESFLSEEENEFQGTVISSSHNKKLNDYGITDLFTYKSLRPSFLILCFLWFLSSFIFYFLSLNSKNYSGNLYLNGIIQFTLEIGVIILVGFLSSLESLGRRGALWIMAIINFASSLVSIFQDEKEYMFTIALTIHRLSISGMYCIVYYVSNEVYPTVLRAKGVGINSVIARVGGIIAPIIVDMISIKTSIILFTILNASSLVFIYFLKETYNIQLHEKPEEDNDELPELKN